MRTCAGHRAGHGPLRRRTPRSSSARDMRESGVELVGRVLRRRAVRGCRHHRPRHGLDRLLVLRVGSPRCARARCSPRRTTRRSTTASRCASRGRGPIGRDTGLAEIEARRKSCWANRCHRSRGGRRELDLLGEWADHVLSFIDVGSLRPLTVVADTANGMGGLVVPIIFDRLPFSVGDPLPRAGRHVPQPPGRPDPAGEPGRAQAGGPRQRRRHRPGLRRGRRPRLPGRREGRVGLGLADHCAGRGVHAHQAPGRDDPLQPHLLPRRARGRHRAGRYPGAHPGGALHHQAGHGRHRAPSSAASTRATTTTATTSGPIRASSPRSSCSSC